MRRLIVLLALGVVLMTAGCSQVLVQTDFDQTANFAALKTYEWYAAEPPVSGDVQSDYPMLDMRVRTAVDTELDAKGYTKVETDPDFFVIYHAAVAREIEVSTTSTAVHPPGYYGWRYVAPPVWVNQTVARTYNKGTLILDVVDARNEKLIWRGAVEGEVDQAVTQQQRKAIVKEAVNKILAEFPPKPME